MVSVTLFQVSQWDHSLQRKLIYLDLFLFRHFSFPCYHFYIELVLPHYLYAPNIYTVLLCVLVTMDGVLDWMIGFIDHSCTIICNHNKL
jgi:hypothetical protein